MPTAARTTRTAPDAAPIGAVAPTARPPIAERAQSIVSRMRERGQSGERIIRLSPAAPSTPSEEVSDDMADLLPIRVRSFKSCDVADVRELFEAGLLGGKLADNDTALDMDDIQSAYFCSPSCHFWVAVDNDEKIVGTIGVQSYEENVGEIRRLRVSPDVRRRGVGSRLLEHAIRFCQDSNFLKIKLDTHMQREPAIMLFEKFHFRHGRTRETHGKQLLVFYLDLYSDDRVTG